MASPALRVCVLGTGIMGAPMARNLAAAGFQVSAWNRTAERAEALAGDGVVAAQTPSAAAERCDVLLTMLADGPAIEEALSGGVLGVLAEDAVWVQTSTVGDGLERLRELADGAGVTLVDSPVLGTAKPAADGTLVVFASGDPAVRERLSPLFDAIAIRTRWVGEEVGAASRLKLVVNHWILGLLENLTETLGLAVTLGVAPDDFLAGIKGGVLDSPYAQFRAGPVLGRAFEPSFRASMARKDVELIRGALDGSGVELPLIAAVGAQLDRAIELGYGDADASATFMASIPPE